MFHKICYHYELTSNKHITDNTFMLYITLKET